MSQSLAQVYLHIVFSTKDRKPYLSDRDLRDELHRYLGGISTELGCPILRVGGVANHVHLLCRLGRSITISDLVKELKRVSTLWIKSKQPQLADFHWQTGYGAFSISPGHVDDLCRYIDDQETHHNAEPFQEEFRRLLTKYGIEWEERYVWD